MSAWYRPYSPKGFTDPSGRSLRYEIANRLFKHTELGISSAGRGFVRHWLSTVLVFFNDSRRRGGDRISARKGWRKELPVLSRIVVRLSGVMFRPNEPTRDKTALC